MINPEILFLKQEDVIQAGLFDTGLVMRSAEETLVKWAKGEILNVTKVGIHLDHDFSKFWTAMPVYIGGDHPIAGFKWAAESHENKKHPEWNLPIGIDIGLLSDATTALPVCIFDADLITAYRTAASGTLGAKYLAKKDARTATLCGAGIVGRFFIKCILHTLPQIKRLEVFDLNQEKCRALVSEFKDIDTDVEIVAVPDIEASVRQADIFFGATTTKTPYLKPEWCKSDATIIHMGPCEAPPDFWKYCDTMIVDNWEQVRNASPLINPYYLDGTFKDGQFTELRHVITGEKTGRVKESDRMLYVSLGIGAMDIYIGQQIYENAKKAGIGQKIYLWDNPAWV